MAKVALVGGNDVRARVAQLGLAKLAPCPRLGRASRVVRRSASPAATTRLRGAAAEPRRDLRVALGIRGPAVGAAARDRATPHRVDVEQDVFPHARRVVEHRAVQRDGVIHRLPEAPLLRRDGIREIRRRQLPLHHQRNAHRRRAPDHFREQGDGVVERRCIANAAVPPAVVRAAGAHRGAGFVLDSETRVHGRPQRLEAQHEQRVEIVVVRVTQRRRPEHRAGRPALVVVVEDLREPLVVQHTIDVLGLGLRGREEVAVVVVADVLLVQPRHAGETALLRHRAPHVPVGDEIVAVRVGVHEQHDDVVQQAQRLVVVAAHHLVDHLAELLRAERLGGVQPSVDPDDGLPFFRERARLGLREAFSEREAARDLLETRQAPVILRRRHDRHVVRPPLRGLADLLQHHAIGLTIELLPVGRDLLVVGQEVVVAEVVSELFPWGCDPGGLRGDAGGERDGQKHDGDARYSHFLFPPARRSAASPALEVRSCVCRASRTRPSITALLSVAVSDSTPRPPVVPGPVRR